MSLSLCSTPKPFVGHIDLIQRNALASWTYLMAAEDVVLLGDEEGTSDAAREFGVRHVPEIARNDHGTPLVDDLFRHAESAARHKLVCYINADIVLMSDMLAAVARIPFDRFLMIGRRCDLDIDEPLDVGAPDWEDRIRRAAATRGRMHGPTGIDYFVYPRGLWGDLPPFALGRTAWDNYLVYRARLLQVPVIDASRVVSAVHQNHDYGHVRGGGEGAWKGPEAQQNLRLAGGLQRVFDIRDADWVLGPRRLARRRDVVHMRRWLERRRTLARDRGALVRDVRKSDPSGPGEPGPLS
ncbi:MAG: hypothetical protein M3290_04140 [Actinomycetota bacterium]|nr:hypothetical protein [Actinomycetota bacterium]